MKHLVTYAYERGFGNVDCRFNNNPPTMQEIREVERAIQEMGELEKTPAIMSWIEIAED